jgi:hypothetical protein
MEPESVLKGRMAETIVSELLHEAGYFVYRFGYEGILQSLTQRGLPKMKEGDIEAEKVRTMPDFIVMNKEGDVSFVEVKFRSSIDFDGTILVLAEAKEKVRKIAKYWPETKLIFVTSKQPYFFISAITPLSKTWKLYPIEREKFLKVNEKIIKKYQSLVKKYFANQFQSI